MQLSAELRWFWRDSVPEPIESWFRCREMTAGGGKQREDVYFVDPAQTHLGIKTRGGRPGIEMKGLLSASVLTFHGTFSGECQIWAKWTLGATGVTSLPRVVVRKTRWFRKLEVRDTEVRELQLDVNERPASSANLPEQGCNIELTSISGPNLGNVWWTVGLEAFGPLSAVQENLHKAVRFLDYRGPTPADLQGSELSYPAWLSAMQNP